MYLYIINDLQYKYIIYYYIIYNKKKKEKYKKFNIMRL